MLISAAERPTITQWRDIVIAAAVAWLVLAASFVHYLIYNSYPLLRLEVAGVCALLLALGLVFGSLYARSGPRVRALAEGVLVCFAIDFNADSMWLAVGLGTAAMVASLWLRRSMLPPLGVMFAVILLSDLGGLAWTAPARAENRVTPSPRSDRPILLHIILDEHIGIEGVPTDTADGRRIRDELKAFYRSNGFHVAGGAYSEHLHTVNAIPHALNFGVAQPPMPNLRSEGVSLKSNAWFDRLATAGYSVRVYQSDYIGYCDHSAVDECNEYRVSGLENLATAPLAPTEKGRLTLLGFLSLSDMILKSSRQYDGIARRAQAVGVPLRLIDLKNHSKVSTINAFAAMDALTADLSRAKPGEAYFAHILAPHYPYSVDAGCRLLPADRWIMRRSRIPLDDRHEAYFDQIRCTNAKLSAALAALARSPAGKHAVVVVHGDHGSRITHVDPKAGRAHLISDADLIAGYSTLFAFRSPAAVAAYDSDRAPLAKLLRSVAEANFERLRIPPASPHATIVLDDQDWRPVEPRDLPKDWPVFGHD